MGLQELLRAGKIEEFNEARSERNGPDLFAAELDGLTLTGADLSSASLDKSDMTGTDLSDVNLARASLNGIDGEDIVLEGVFAVKARLREAWMERAKFANADFSRADLSGAVLNHSQGEGANFTSARLKGAQGQSAQWGRADFTEANLKQGDYTKASFRDATLTAARCANADFSGACLDGVSASEANFQGAAMKGASLVGANLSSANLSGVDLTGADLRHANLEKANLTDADLTGANLMGADLVNAALDGAVLEGANLEGADMTGIDPHTIGLSSDQTSALAGVGWVYDEKAPLRFSDVAVGQREGQVVGLWVNLDGGESASVRWVLMGPSKPLHGVLPVAPETVVARAVVPVEDRFDLFLIQERSAGYAVVRYPLSVEGQLGAAQISPLGYEPAVIPVIRAGKGGAWMWGLARRGPTLVLHRDGPEGFVPALSKPMSTARGFLGRMYPLMACKGGVLLSIKGGQVGAPLRSPSGYPPRMRATVPWNDQVLAAWYQEKKGRTPGGLYYVWMGQRGAPDPEFLTAAASVVSMDGYAMEDGVWLAWIQGDQNDFGPTKVCVCRLPGGEISELDLEGIDAEELRFIAGPSVDTAPLLAVTTIDEEIVVCGLDGAIVARAGGGSE
jgi:uncharacterized protein YjbI with pentapeptide repeats